jgi:PLP dependent protein
VTAAAASPGDVVANVAAVRARIDAAAVRAGRDPAAVTLVAAAKTMPAELVVAAVVGGIRDIGENRAQELLAKAPLVGGHPPPRWHFLGALQRNKVRQLAPLVGLWQSVDREALGDEIARRAPGAHVLVEVNLAAEPQKAGCTPEDAPALVDRLRAMDLCVEGLMAIPPPNDDPCPWFASLRSLAESIDVQELSMGMTDDFELAIEEGATMVRVGRAIFGARPG